MALYNAVPGTADPVKFTNSMNAVDTVIQRIVQPGIISGLTVDGGANVQTGEALIGHVVAVTAITNVQALLAASATNYVYLQMPVSPTCVAPDGRDTGVIVINQTGVAPINAVLLASIVSGVGAPPAITSVNTAPVGRVQLQLTLARNADFETPAGLVNSANTVYTLAHAPTPGTSLRIYSNGVLQNPSTYSLAGSTITFTTAPATGVWLTAFYRY